MEGYADYSAGLRTASTVGGASTVQPPTPVNPSCFGNIEDVKEMAISTASRVERLVDRMVGAEPKAEDSSELVPGCFGLLNVADDHARTIRGALQNIIDNCNRLEKHLP
ncbi:MAG: hypothetical protein ACOY4R_27535 [Pseudomonadota bacterium]